MSSHSARPNVWGRLSRRGLDLIRGKPSRSLLGEVTRRQLDRWNLFLNAADFLAFEKVEGDFMEFGVFGGLSLALLSAAYRCDPKGVERRVVGYDSFWGLPDGEEEHERWSEGDCARIHGWHPLVEAGEPVTAQTTLDLFASCGLPAPEIECGPFERTLPATIPSKYAKAALIHVDCDLYESTKLVLEAVPPILQEGTVFLFDEWFSYKGNPNRGEARAFGEFLDRHPEWAAQDYRAYGTLSKAFILYRP